MFKKCYQFLGSIYFTIIILIFLALYIIIGTIVESITNSHLYAASITYSSTFFIFILSCAFLNILISALRRWPFKKKHIPFLITHLGLLMIISGVMVKNFYGYQGNMLLKEGTSSNQIFIPQTYVINIEKKGRQHPDEIFEIKPPYSSRESYPVFSSQNDDLKIQLLDYTTHASFNLCSWVKNHFCYICGLDPIYVSKDNNEISVSSRLKMFKNSDEIWDVYALNSKKNLNVLKKLYLKDSKFILRKINNNKFNLNTSLHHVLNHELKNEKLNLKASISLKEMKIKFFQNEKIYEFSFDSKNILKSTPWKIGNYLIEMHHTPKLIFLKNEDQITFYAIDRYGHIYSEIKSEQNQGTIITYDRGYGGYFSTIEIPFPSHSYGSITRTKARLFELESALQKASKRKKSLAPPITLIKTTAKKTNIDFIETFLKILLGQKVPDDFYTNIQWKDIPKNDLKASFWSFYLNDLNINKKTLYDQSTDLNIGNIEYEDFNHLRSKVFQAADLLPEIPIKQFTTKINKGILQQYLNHYGISQDNLLFFTTSMEEEEKTLKNYLAASLLQRNVIKNLPFIKFLSKKQKLEILSKLPLEHHFFKNFHINNMPSKEDFLKLLKHKLHLDLISEVENYGDNYNEKITLESPIYSEIVNLPSNNVLEENIPAITLKITKGKKSQIIKLIYDSLGKGWKWPALDGQYLLSFKPKFHQLPVKVRLHEAKEIKYPHSNQPFSYESDLFITEDNIKKPFSISMNHVYESNSGYRFYLSNIATMSNGLRRIQLAVNYDPLKMLLTYPGGILVTLGIISLFWLKTRNNAV